jgi:hypothetical protein
MKKYLAIAAAFLCLMLAASHSYAQIACVAGSNYTTTTGAGVIVPGTLDTGNHCDDCATNIPLPFPVRIYNLGPFNTVNVISNGNLQFTSSDATFTNVCLPNNVMIDAIFPMWDDFLTTGAGGGIFTSISGVTPNRIFNIEWRNLIYFGGAGTANFEVRLHEANALFEVITGAISGATNSATVGVQRDTGSMFTQFTCNGAPVNVPQNTQINFICTLVPVELMGISVE